MNKKTVKNILLFLIILDAVLVIGVIFVPQWWFLLFHGTSDFDGQNYAFLYRCAANWFAFLIIQLIAFFKWEQKPWLLLLVAGARFGDVFTDMTYLHFSPQNTILAWLSFPFAGVAINFLTGICLVKFYLNIQKTKI